MPFPLVPLIIAGVSSAISAISASRQNKKTNQTNMALARYQYETSKAETDRMNAYNTPANQMARFGAAGLNPNLVYGQGSPGNQAQPAKYDAPQVDYKHASFDPMLMLQTYSDFRLKNAQTNNIEADTESKRSGMANDAIQRLLMGVNKERAEFDLQQSKALGPYSLEGAKLENQIRSQKLQDILFDVFAKGQTNEERIKAMQANYERARSTADKVEADKVFSQLRSKLFKDTGMTPQDNMWLRIIISIAQSMGLDPMTFIK